MCIHQVDYALHDRLLESACAAATSQAWCFAAVDQGDVRQGHEANDQRRKCGAMEVENFLLSKRTMKVEIGWSQRNEHKSLLFLPA